MTNHPNRSKHRSAMLNLSYMPDTADTGGWKERHRQSIYGPVGRALSAWCAYAAQHERRFESPIGEDYVLGPAWAEWGRALRELLNGETGGLDCGTLDHILVNNLTAQGYEP